MVKDINSNELPQLVANNRVVFIDCYANWCQPCKILGPILKELDEKFQDKGLKVVKIDVDQNKEFSAENQISGIPTVFVYSGGKRVRFDGNGQKLDRLVGVMSYRVYEHVAERLLFEPI